MEPKRCHACMKIVSGPVCEHCGYQMNTPAPRHHLAPGTVLNGQYYIGRALGQGGFGITYFGWDLNLDTPVAIKEYFPTGYVHRDNTQSQEVVGNQQTSNLFQNGKEYFLREAKSLAKLATVPEIVHIRTYFQANGTAYIVMEYITGMPLHKYVMNRGYRISTNEALAILKPVMEALARVHDANLIHRDISPDNIMLMPNGKVKLLDFGAARSSENADPSKALPKSTQAVAKHGYTPVEQYQTRGALGPWTDVYALCATFFFCITGSSPTPAMDRMVYQQNFDWANLAPELNSYQVATLNKGLALAPKDRIGSVRELYRGLYGREMFSDAGQSANPPQPAQNAYPKTTPVAPQGGNAYPATTPVNPKGGNAVPTTVPVNPKGGNAVPATVPVNPKADKVYPATAPVTPKAGTNSYPATAPVTPKESSNAQSASAPKAENPVPEKTAPAAPQKVSSTEMPGQKGKTDSGNQKEKASSKPDEVIRKSKAPLIIVAAIALIALVVCFFTVHIWKDADCTHGERCALCGKAGEDPALGHDFSKATCTEDGICSRCGEVAEEATGHDWQPANCANPETCSRCGAKEGRALGHDWMDATYDAPQTCRVCQETNGHVKGWVGTPEGDWEAFYTSTSSSWAWVLKEPVENCKRYTMNLIITDVTYGEVTGTWMAYRKLENGTWAQIGTFELEGDTASIVYEFDEPTTLYGVAAVIHGGRYCSFTKEMNVSDVVVFVD